MKRQEPTDRTKDTAKSEAGQFNAKSDPTKQLTHHLYCSTYATIGLHRRFVEINRLFKPHNV